MGPVSQSAYFLAEGGGGYLFRALSLERSRGYGTVSNVLNPKLYLTSGQWIHSTPILLGPGRE